VSAALNYSCSADINTSGRSIGSQLLLLLLLLLLVISDCCLLLLLLLLLLSQSRGVGRICGGHGGISKLLLLSTTSRLVVSFKVVCVENNGYGRQHFTHHLMGRLLRVGIMRSHRPISWFVSSIDGTFSPRVHSVCFC